MPKLTYKNTVQSCFVCFFMQANLVNFAPLLFVTFQETYALSFAKITSLITISFLTQLVTDLVCIKYVEKFGARNAMLLAHATVAVGLAGLAVFPAIFPTPYMGLLAAVICYGIGGGLVEVLGNPIVEACPSENTATTLSLLHSFYCWGVVLTVLLSTAFFAVFGIENWRILACLWALLPIINGIYFYFVPLPEIQSEHHLSMKALVKNKFFWVLLMVMICAGASEQAMSQWASTFAEKGLGVSKSVGDLAGPCLFAITMGISRVFYGKFGDKIKLERFMVLSGALCMASYLVVALCPIPFVAFLASAVCGLAVGIMWPGTVSIGAQKIPAGGTAMFAFLAFAGDIGCSSGPTVTGAVFEKTGLLQSGFAAVLVFPVLLIVGVLICAKAHAKEVV